MQKQTLAIAVETRGEIIYESIDYEIRNKTYEQLPAELKDRFFKDIYSSSQKGRFNGNFERRILFMEQMGHTDIACTENHYHRNRRSIDAKSQIISSIPEFQAK